MARDRARDLRCAWLITNTVAVVESDAKVGRAKPLQRAMVGMIDNGEVWEAQIQRGALFHVFGEGGKPKSGSECLPYRGALALSSITVDEFTAHPQGPCAWNGHRCSSMP